MFFFFTRAFTGVGVEAHGGKGKKMREDREQSAEGKKRSQAVFFSDQCWQEGKKREKKKKKKTLIRKGKKIEKPRASSPLSKFDPERSKKRGKKKGGGGIVKAIPDKGGRKKRVEFSCCLTSPLSIPKEEVGGRGGKKKKKRKRKGGARISVGKKKDGTRKVPNGSLTTLFDRWKRAKKKKKKKKIGKKRVLEKKGGKKDGKGCPHRKMFLLPKRRFREIQWGGVRRRGE